MTDSDDNQNDFSKAAPQNPSSIASSRSTLSSSAIVEILRKRHIGIPLLGLITLAAIGLVVISKEPTHLPHASSEPDPLAEERPAITDFTIQSVDGHSFKLSENGGKVILVSFWSSDCSTCVLELPAFSELLKRYGKEGLKVVSINLDPTEEGGKNVQNIKELWSRGHFEFPAYADPNRTVAKTFEIQTVPSGFVIDRKGRMAFNSYGANDWLAPETARLLEDLLLEK